MSTAVLFRVWSVSITSPGSLLLSVPCKAQSVYRKSQEPRSKGETFQGWEIPQQSKRGFNCQGETGRNGRKAEAVRIFRGQRCQQGLESWTGRFSQLWAEPGVRSCDSGYLPAPRQISFARKKLSPSSTSGSFYEVYDPCGLVTVFFFFFLRKKVRKASFPIFHFSPSTGPLWESTRPGALVGFKLGIEMWGWARTQDLLAHTLRRIFKSRKCSSR